MYAARLILVLLLVPVASALQISEILSNPVGSDTGHEWLEIYNNDTTEYNLTGWKINTDNTDHSFNVPPANGGQGSILIVSGEYIVLVQDASLFLADYPGYNGTVIDSSWADLSNSANETIWLKNSTNVFDNLTFTPAGEGNTTCLFNGTFQACNPTPGIANQLPSSTPATGSNPTYNNTIPTVNATCNLSLSIIIPEIINVSQTNYDIVVNDTSCSPEVIVEYWIEDLFGNIVKERTNTTQSLSCSKTISRQWTPDSLEGSEAYRIFAVAGCAAAEKIVIVKGTSTQDSLLAITNLDPAASYGDEVDVQVYVYRNSTSKYSVDVWAQGEEKISEVTTFHAKSKNTHYNLTLPLHLKSNCDNRYPDGVYTLVAEGLDKNSTANITISGLSPGFCKTVTVSSGSSSGGGSSSSGSGSSSPTKAKVADLVFYPEVVSQGEAFELNVSLNSPKKTFSLYSYVYSGNTLASEGGWTPNKVAVTVSGKSSVLLVNKIKNDTEPGIYSLRVKIKGDVDEEITKQIEVVKEDKSVEKTGSVANDSKIVKKPILTAKTILPATGMTIAKSKPHYLPLLLLILPRLF